MNEPSKTGGNKKIRTYGVYWSHQNSVPCSVVSGIPNPKYCVVITYSYVLICAAQMRILFERALGDEQ